MKKLILLVLLLSTTACFSASVHFKWDLSASDPTLGPTGGYRMYQGKTCDVLLPITTVPTGISDLIIDIPHGKYCNAVTAFDSEGSESDFSNKVSHSVKPDAPLNLVELNK